MDDIVTDWYPCKEAMWAQGLHRRKTGTEDAKRQGKDSHP